jgi:hypothetical protein
LAQAIFFAVMTRIGRIAARKIYNEWNEENLRAFPSGHRSLSRILRNI